MLQRARWFCEDSVNEKELWRTKFCITIKRNKNILLSNIVSDTPYCSSAARIICIWNFVDLLYIMFSLLYRASSYWKKCLIKVHRTWTVHLPPFFLTNNLERLRAKNSSKLRKRFRIISFSNFRWAIASTSTC